MDNCFVIIWVKSDKTDKSNDESFTKRIQEFNWARLNESNIWVIESEKNCAQIRDILLNYIGESDFLYVFRISGFAAFTTNEVNKWLKNNI